MKLNFRFKDLLGNGYSSGNVIFDSRGDVLMAGVGNRVRVFDLVRHKAETLRFELRRNVRRICLSNDSSLLIAVDTEGRGVIVHMSSRSVLHRFHMKAKVRRIAFSPDDLCLAISVGRHVQVWRTPSSLQKEVSPLVLHRTYTGHNDAVVSINWSPCGRYFITGSKDRTAKVYSLNPEEGFVVVTLTGHKERVIGCFFREKESILTLSSDGSLIEWKWKWKDSNESSLNAENAVLRPLSIKFGEWIRVSRVFVQKDHAKVKSCAYNREKGLLVLGLTSGVFSLFEMPDATHLQSLSVSQHSLGSVAINNSGEWLGVGSIDLGQVLVWEWKSESYVLKQQGHFYDLSTIAYSPNGQHIATGGDDAKVKIWDTSSGFCFVTFSEHEAPVTAVTFVGEVGNAVLSSSLDGTVRAFDLVRYRNFRTMVPPQSAQLTCLTVDGMGEIVCAGAMDPPEIYVWSLQTGRLLDVLAGHEGPLSSLSFSPARPLLASTSWDQTMRLWEPYNSAAPIETKSLGSDGVCVTFRPDGKEICAGALNGQLVFFDTDSGDQTGVIEGSRDVSGGRRNNDRTTAKNGTHNKHFTSVCYTADGSCIIAGGRSKFVCIYQVRQRVMLKKYQLSHSRSLEGVLDKLHSARDTEAGPIDTLDLSDASDSEMEDAQAKAQALPGANRGDHGKRCTRPDIRCKAVTFSPTGQEWAAASTEGLLVYALDSAMLFTPFELSEDVTPAKAREFARSGQFGKAFLIALHIGEDALIKEIYRAIPEDETELVANAIPLVYAQRVIEMIADELESSFNLQHNLLWSKALLSSHQDRLRGQAPQFLSAFRNLQKAIVKHKKNLSQLCNDNMYLLSFMCKQKPAQRGELFQIITTHPSKRVKSMDFDVE